MSDSARHPLDAAFRPRSVCFIGVSGDPKKTSGTPLRYLVRHGYEGAVYPVNPKYDEIEGLKCYPDVASLPEAPDCAFISLPAAAVPDAVEEAGKKGVRSAVILSSGFEETEGGASHAERLREAANRHGVAVVGPNSEGVWSVGAKAILTFGSAADRDDIAHGRIAVVTQSGGIGGGLSRQLLDGGYGLAYFVSVGNEVNVGIPDYIDYLSEQDDVSTILIFMEGLNQGPKLVPACARARAKGINLVAVKSGNSARGREATASHTGKISTPGDIYHDVLDQAGIVQVDSLIDLFDAGRVLSYLRPVGDGGTQGGLGILSVLGGPRSIMADRCEEWGVPLATYAPETETRLKKVVPAFGYAPNPTDITGHIVGHPELLQESLDAAAADPHAEAFIVQFGNGGVKDAREKREMFVDFANKSGKPLVLSLIGDTLDPALVAAYARDGVMVARDAAEAVKYVGWLYKAREIARRAPGAAVPATSPPATRPLPSGWQATEAFLQDAGIPLPPSRLLPAGGDAAETCSGLRFPVCVKALPEDAEHKTEKGL
ncbi:MAG: CoA-binding protein, partial [Acetobacterales bacterium]